LAFPGSGANALPGDGPPRAGRDPRSLRRAFEFVAKHTSRWLGHPFAFVLAIAAVVVWAFLGPVNRYSDTWQLVINTATTIITFLMVFLIQNSQNRDNAAIQAKLDELIRAMRNAKNEMIGLEDLSGEELEAYHQRFAKLAEEARAKCSEAVDVRKSMKKDLDDLSASLRE